MLTSDFDYKLPEELIAQERVHPFDHSRLLLLNKLNGEYRETQFFNIIDVLTQNDVLVFNDTKVFKARLVGKKESGSECEVLLLEAFSPMKKTFRTIIKGKVHKGSIITFSDRLSCTVVDLYENGDREILFSQSGEELTKNLTTLAHIPLPHYINTSPEKENDYQTVYAKDEHMDSIAAPTAGFHFTEELLEKIATKGIRVEFVTLNVGIGTFRPVKEDDITKHEMHYETYTIDDETLNRLNKYKKEGKRIIAVGTTSTRTLEDSADKDGILQKHTNNTNIFIYPPYEFKFVDALITNFHLPKSTLLMLVSALSKKEYILNAYNYAVDEKFRFFSFGDAMFIY